MVPVPESLESAWGIFAKLIAANRGHPQMGRELKASFVEAGLGDVRASASFDMFSSAQDIAFLHNVAIGWFFSPDVVGAATKYGLATQEEFDEWRRSLDAWKDDPGAFGCIAFGECLAANP